MSRYCQNCGAEAAAGTAFCAACGKPMSEETSPQTQQASSGDSAQTFAPPQPKQSVAAPQVAPQVSPQAPPPGGGKSRKGLILGGLAAAGVLGFIALIAVGAAIYFFALAPEDPAPQPNPTPQPAPDPNPTPQPADDEQPVEGGDQPVGGGEQPVEPAPESGSLDELVQEQVGDFTLDTINTIPEAIDAGAIDARGMLYFSSDGVSVQHELTAWPSPDEANQILVPFADGFVSDGAQVVDEFEVTGQDGEPLGTAIVLLGADGTEIFLWTNGSLFCAIYAPEGYGADFFNNLTY